MKAGGRWAPALLGAVVALALVARGNDNGAAEPEQPAAERVGTELCLQCHAHLTSAWRYGRHSRLMESRTLPEHMRGCEGCHGPGSNHLTDENFRQIENPNHLSGLAAVRACLTCHKSDVKAAQWLATPHAEAGLNCGSCHEVHEQTDIPSQLKRPANELCLSCHQDQEATFRLNSHHPVREGRLDCIDCHNPHQGGPDADHLLKTGDDLCLECHNEKQGPFVFEHQVSVDAGGEGCLTCHRGHGSPNPKLTRYFGRGLCLQCHSDIAADPPHRARGGDCWRSGCHAALHGSNTNRLFIK